MKDVVVTQDMLKLNLNLIYQSIKEHCCREGRADQLRRSQEVSEKKRRSNQRLGKAGLRPNISKVSKTDFRAGGSVKFWLNFDWPIVCTSIKM